MLVLGIETSCDETGAAVVHSDGRVLSDVVHSQIEVHAPYGGIVPELASRDHVRNGGHVVREALAQADVKLADVDAIAVTHRPGLVGALLVGVHMAKGMAWGAGKPLVGVDHLVGHLLSVFLQRGEERSTPPSFPFLCLLVSGGHTAVYRVEAAGAEGMYELGATRDDAAGECFDKVAKCLGLGYPGGPRIDQWAEQGDPSRFQFVTPLVSTASFEFSFSGLKTQMARHVATYGKPSHEKELADICASFQTSVVEVLARKLIRAAEVHHIDQVVLGGGVAANRQLRARVRALAQMKGMQAFLPEHASCTDNGAMIAYAGAARALQGQSDGWDLNAFPTTVLARVTRKGRGRRT